MRGVAAAIAAILFALSAVAADTPPLVESDPSELARTIPELAGLRVAPAPGPLDEILRLTGAAVAATAEGFKEAPVPEEIHEMRFEEGGMSAASRSERATYSIAWSGTAWREARTGLEAGGPTGFFITGGFLESLRFLRPASIGETRFLFLGRMKEGGQESGQEALVLAWMRPMGAVHRQGLLWIDEATKRVLRVRLSMYERVEGVPLESWSTDIRLTATGSLAQVTVSAGLPDRELLTVHRFAGANTGEEPLELMARGLALTQDKQAAAAVPLLREAQRRDPQRRAIQYYLGSALSAAGDFAAAETELRGVVKALPDSAVAHNALGIALYRRGDFAAAAIEFRECLRLKPGDPVAKENLAKALAPPSAPADAIRVDVRQVIVPVVVTGSDGHFTTDLKQSDFQILEDGVEQKISSFSVERSGLTADIRKNSPKALPDAAVQNSATPSAPRRNYLICIDTVHSSLPTFSQVRQALIKLFQSERKGDARYAVIALGVTIQVVQNMTTDPDEVLRALEDRQFQKLFQSSRTGSAAAEIERFERTLSDTRIACDSRDPMCAPKRESLPSMAAAIADADRVQTITYLGNLRSLVDQMGRAGGRRTLVLISAGFQMVPGRDAYELLSAYFPEIRGVQLRTIERMTEVLEPVFRLAAKNNVVIHTIDSRGLYVSSYREASRSSGGGRVGPSVERALNRVATEAGSSLDEIADATGGTSYRNSNDMLIGLSRAFADGRDYYVLSYVPANPATDGKYRAITVRVRDTKLVIHAKRGYWAAEP